MVEKKEKVRDSLMEDCFGNVAGRKHCHILTEDVCLFGACPFYKTRAKFDADRKRYCGVPLGVPDYEAVRDARRKKVRCINSGKVYLSISEAAWDCGISVHALSRVLHGAQKTASGFKFEYL